MKTNQIAAGGAVLFLAGLIVGAIMNGGGPDMKEIDAAIARHVDAASATQTAQIGEIEAGLTQLSSDLSGKIDGVATGVAAGVDSGAKAVADVGDKIGGDVQTLGQSLQSAIETSSASHMAALESGLAGLRGQVSQVAPAAAAPAEGAAAEPEAATAAPVDGVGPGETAMLSDGALSVFVSRIDEASGTAYLRANGHDLVLAAGKSETVPGQAGDCQLTLDAVGGGKAAVSGACGDALPAPDGTAPGTAIDLAEGLRVFVSSVSDTGARIAVNGVNTVTLPVGEAIEATVGDKTCSVSVESVDRGRVALGYVCG